MRAIAIHCRSVAALADDEGLELFHEVVAMIGIDLKGDRLGKIQTEDAQNGLAIYDMATYAKIDVVGVTVGDVDKGLNVLGKTQLDIDCFHAAFPHFTTCGC